MDVRSGSGFTTETLSGRRGVGSILPIAMTFTGDTSSCSPKDLFLTDKSRGPSPTGALVDASPFCGKEGTLSVLAADLLRSKGTIHPSEGESRAFTRISLRLLSQGAPMNPLARSKMFWDDKEGSDNILEAADSFAGDFLGDWKRTNDS